MVDTTQWGAVEQLVLAVGGRDEQLLDVIAEQGPARIADLLAREIQIRGTAPDGVSDVYVVLSMLFQDEQFRYLVSFKDGQMQLEPGASEGILADIRYQLSDLVRLLYPSRNGYVSTSRDVAVVTWPWTGRDGDYSDLWPDKVIKRSAVSPEQRAALGMNRMSILFKAVNAVIAACTGVPGSLSGLASKYGSDKWGALHFYTPHYEDHFGPLRFDPVKVLEIGIGGYNHPALGGESIYMWQEYFPRGLIYGMDLFDKPGVVGPRIRTIQGDQSDREFLRALGEAEGPFDIIVDDGSHVNEHVRISFQELYPYVRPGGYYVIEDLHTAYWPEFGGELPPGSSNTSVGLLKDLLDELHRCEYVDNDREPIVVGHHPSDICVYHNVAVLRKGIAHERGIPAWVKERADQWINPGGGH